MSLKENETEYQHLMNTDWSWTIGARDPACGKITLVYVDDGVVLINANYRMVGIQDCYTWTNPNCTMDLGRFSTDTNTFTDMNFSFAVQDYHRELQVVDGVGKTNQLTNGDPVWGVMEKNQGGEISMNLYSAVQRNDTNPENITGLIVFTLQPSQVVGMLKDILSDAVSGIYIMDVHGQLISSTLENITDGLCAYDSNVTLVRQTYAKMPQNLTSGEPVILSVSGYAVAYNKMQTDYNLECIVVTLGHERCKNMFIVS